MALKSWREESWIKEKLTSYRVLTGGCNNGTIIPPWFFPGLPWSQLNNNKSKVNKQKIGKANCDH